MFKKTILVLLILSIATLTAYAHPHVFADCTINVEFDENGMTGYLVQWKFDEMFSSQLIVDYDQNESWDFDKEEVAFLKQDAFDNLKNFNYFVLSVVNKKEIPVTDVKRFRAYITDKQFVTYEFFVPLKVAGAQTDTAVQVASFDNTYYVAITLKAVNDNVDRNRFVAETTVRENKEKAFFGGEVSPQEAFIQFRRKM